MLDFNHVMATPGADVQYFQGPNWIPSATPITVTAIATAGVLTVSAGTYYVGQAVQITGDYLPGTITGHTSGAIYYIITVTSTTSITISASFGGAAVTSSATTITAVTLAVGGVLTVTTGAWKVGQPITITGTFTAGSITGYVTGTTYYIITVTSATSITISATPGGAAVTSTAGTATPGATFTVVGSATWTPLVTQWQTWRKPRGVKWVYLLGVGAGASGGTGINTGTTSGGGSGGGSGSQTMVMIPAIFVPDTLYVACGNGGAAQSTPGVPGLPGTPTVVAIEPDTVNYVNMNLLWAYPGLVTGTAATATAGGVAGANATNSTLAQMPLAGRGLFNAFGAQPGIAGGPNTAIGPALTISATGLIVTGGTGGGGCNAATGFAGGAMSAVTGTLGQDFFPTVAGGAAAVTSTPGGRGINFIARYFMMNYGGTGGGGATTTAGGAAGAGADGAPGCGGGGSGGANTTNTVVQSGAGGPGFVYILAW